ncbi:MAG: hypothetical protein Q8O30_11380 [Candidatus Omnitrophota bacterium]|nr:hypothetical protein [Candidatus Omnitrophota bacterium]
MIKTKIYRILGAIFLGIGLYNIIYGITHPRTFQAIVNPSPIQIFMMNLHIRGYFAFDYGLWIGLILQWRADKNKNSKTKSLWGKILVGYLIYAALIALWYLFKGIYIFI